MSWRDQIDELAKTKKRELDELEESKKQSAKAKRRIISRFGPVVRKIARTLGGYVAESYDDRWSLHLTKPDGSGTHDCVRIEFNHCNIIVKTYNPTTGYTGKPSGGLNIYDPFTPSGYRFFVADEETLENRLAEVIAKCVKAIRH